MVLPLGGGGGGGTATGGGSATGGGIQADAGQLDGGFAPFGILLGQSSKPASCGNVVLAGGGSLNTWFSHSVVTGQGPPSVVELRRAGSCFVFSPFNSSQWDGGTVVTTFFNGGEVIVSGGAQQAFALRSDGGMRYPTFNSSRPLWDGGERLNVAVAGQAPVPTWTGTIVASSSLKLLSTNLSGASVSRSQPLSLSWTPATEGVVELSLTANNASLSCRFPAVDGQGVVSDQLLGMLSPGEAPGALSHTVRVEELDARLGWKMIVQLSSFMTDPAGCPFIAPVLQ